MSRTHKDAPYEVKKRRLELTREEKPGCSLCETESERTVTTGFTAIFFAHEVQAIEKFIEATESYGYRYSVREIRGYLGQDHYEPLQTRSSRHPLKPRKSLADFLVAKDRAIYRQPRGVESNLICDSQGYASETAKKPVRHSIFSFGSRRNKVFEWEAPRQVSTKENIFTVISVEKTSKIKGGRSWHYHDANEPWYLLNGHCHCSFCEPENNSEKVKFRSAEAKLRKAYNSGDVEALEDLSAELAAQSSKGYRD